MPITLMDVGFFAKKWQINLPGASISGFGHEMVRYLGASRESRPPGRTKKRKLRDPNETVQLFGRVRIMKVS
jgi:hypothetical protein